MRKSFLVNLLLGLLVGSPVLAQSISTSADRYSSETSASGFRVSILTSVLKLKVEVSGGGQSISASDDLDSSLGLSFGYAHLPVRQLGYTAAGSLISLRAEGDDATMWRLGGNLAYAINSTVAFYGGLNLSNITTGEYDRYMDAGIGAQIGANFQFNETFGMEIGLVGMRQVGKFSGVKIEATEAGPELSFHGTF